MDKEIFFQVQGSAAEPYMIRVGLDPLTLSCTCQAGHAGIPCKHRISILKGDCTDAIAVPQNEDAVLSKVGETANNS
ncbi:MAG: SWIM zinc finger family protein, partial [Treponema sp.]|nr:SWIM zinc finger family protein [Treponema sp.]